MSAEQFYEDKLDGLTPYGFPESQTPLCDKYIRESSHDFALSSQQLDEVRDRLQGENVLRLAQAVGLDRETVRQGLIRAGLSLVAVRP